MEQCAQIHSWICRDISTRSKHMRIDNRRCQQMHECGWQHTRTWHTFEINMCINMVEQMCVDACAYLCIEIEWNRVWLQLMSCAHLVMLASATDLCSVMVRFNQYCKGIFGETCIEECLDTRRLHNANWSPLAAGMSKAIQKAPTWEPFIWTGTGHADNLRHEAHVHVRGIVDVEENGDVRSQVNKEIVLMLKYVVNQQHPPSRHACQWPVFISRLERASVQF